MFGTGERKKDDNISQGQPKVEVEVEVDEDEDEDGQQLL